jgi:hypothetical protein
MSWENRISEKGSSKIWITWSIAILYLVSIWDWTKLISWRKMGQKSEHEIDLCLAPPLICDLWPWDKLIPSLSTWE